MISLPSGPRIWLVAGVMDMCKSFNGLGELVQHVLDKNQFSSHLFIFRDRKGDTVKIFLADADALSMFTKRSEGGVFIWPATERAYRIYKILTKMCRNGFDDTFNYRQEKIRVII